MKGVAQAFALLGLVITLYAVRLPKASALDVNYYAQPFTNHFCPLAPALISNLVAGEVSRNRAVAAQLLRLHFHDCFVRLCKAYSNSTLGCDGSALIFKADHTAERDGLPNVNSLAGFDIIENVKTAVEALCPGIVSCADIVAQAARDAVVALAGLAGPIVSWAVPLGRKDGVISLASEADVSIPSPLADIATLISQFGAKGLSPKQLVLLSGAHTIGTASCNVASLRLYPVTDPELNSVYANYLKFECPNIGTTSKRIAMKDFLDNPLSNNFVFDHEYYVNVKEGKGLFKSDNNLLKSPLTQPYVDQYAGFFSNLAFINDFKGAMIAMGNIGVLNTGNVRKVCSVAGS